MAPSTVASLLKSHFSVVSFTSLIFLALHHSWGSADPLPADAFSGLQNAPKSTSAGLCPRPNGTDCSSPQTHSWWGGARGSSPRNLVHLSPPGFKLRPFNPCCLNLPNVWQFKHWDGACERSRSGRISSQRSNLFLWLCDLLLRFHSPDFEPVPMFQVANWKRVDQFPFNV